MVPVSNQELTQRIEHALDTIREYLRSDGGDVRVHALLSDGTLELELLGSCSSCSMSHMTMKAGVEQAILRSVPEITRVVTV